MAKDYNDIDWDNWSYDENDDGKGFLGDEEEEHIVKDANGNILKAGDTVIAIKDLPVKGGQNIKRGDKFTKIKLTDDPELIESGNMVLRTEFFKKI
ncbi:MAG: PhnA domain-containing protein [Candidatus Gracilibacteria bacterium]|nr:PhnA domain-containing protein [Candidatus Gracilibacteria bacterium]